jgi:hypothetical protein
MRYKQHPPTVTNVTVLGHWLLSLTFSDGKSGVADISDLATYNSDLFVPLRDPGYFAQARLDPEAGTVVWPNGADPAPEYLRDHLIKDRNSKNVDDIGCRQKG